MGPEQLRVLLVEDNPGDVRLTEEAFKDANVQINLYVAQDGIEAMDFLYRKGSFCQSPRPDLILLDLNLPRMDGRDVLAEIKVHPKLKAIPVVILTTSSSEVDVESSYMLHANCYISKPLEIERFLTVVRSIDNFWLSMVSLPPQEQT